MAIKKYWVQVCTKKKRKEKTRIHMKIEGKKLLVQSSKSFIRKKGATNKL